MVNRRTLLTAGVALGAFAAFNSFRSRGALAATMTTTTDTTIDFKKLSAADWQKRLSRTSSTLLRKHGTERAGTSPLNKEKRKGIFRLRRLRPGAVFIRYQVRKRYRLAEFLAAFAERSRRDQRPLVLHDAHRSALQPLRRSSRPRLQ